MKKKLSYNSYAVIGLGFGDEGKGVTVNSLCQSLNNPLVIRYSGGQQAGHTVMLKDGTKHVFSNFGSGGFQGAITYWSKYCSFDPVGVVNELKVLKDKGYSPTLYVDKKSPVTTPYDKHYNQSNKEILQHGTCGVGVGATFKREEDYYSLTAGDLLFESVLKIKLEMIKEYYGSTVDTTEFIATCKQLTHPLYGIFFVDGIPDFSGSNDYIFEGSQGLLLDQNIGFFPHVTRSNVGSKNILEMGYEPKLYLVTRAFQTRHGNGPMTNLDKPHNIRDNPYEINVNNKYQGEFKKSLLDLDLLKYGIERDDYIRESKNKNLVITCMDLIEDEYRYTVDGEIVCHLNADSFARGVADHLGVERVHTISSPHGTIDII